MKTDVIARTAIERFNKIGESDGCMNNITQKTIANCKIIINMFVK